MSYALRAYPLSLTPLPQILEVFPGDYRKHVRVRTFCVALKNDPNRKKSMACVFWHGREFDSFVL